MHIRKDQALVQLLPLKWDWLEYSSFEPASYFTYGYVPPIWVAYWVKNSLNKGLFQQIFLKHGCVFQKWAKNCKKNWWFSAKIHHKSGMVSFGNKKRVAF